MTNICVICMLQFNLRDLFMLTCFEILFHQTATRYGLYKYIHNIIVYFPKLNNANFINNYLY